MLKKPLICLSALFVMNVSLPVMAENKCVDDKDKKCSAEAKSAAETKPVIDASLIPFETAVNESFKSIGGTVKSVKPAPIKGLYEVVVDMDGRPDLAYIDESRKFLVRG